ncbi:MAG: hypothetical protein ACXVZP_11385 [Gaiellaceae bacterium]
MLLLLAAIHPVPQAATPDGSITGWIWLTIVLALIVTAGLVLTSRR